MQDYVEKNFTSGRVALVGVGVDSNTLESLGSEFKLYAPQSSGTGAANYHAGELSYILSDPTENCHLTVKKLPKT